MTTVNPSTRKDKSKRIKHRDILVTCPAERPVGVAGAPTDHMVSKVTAAKKNVSAEKYQSVFENMHNGLAYHEIVLDQKGKPIDYVFLEINDAYEKLLGVNRRDYIGKRATEAIPGVEDDLVDWIGTFGKVATRSLSDLTARWYNFPEQREGIPCR